MGRRRCCCPDVVDCPLFFGVFEPCSAAGLDVDTDDWIVVSGTWKYKEGDTQDCVLAGESGIIVTVIESSRIAQHVAIKIEDAPDAGTIIGIILNYLNENNYYYVEISANSTSIKHADGTIFKTEAVGWDDTTEITACMSASGSISALIAEPHPQACVTPIPGGFRAGLRNDGSEVFVETFNFQEHKDTDPDCLSCCCHDCGSTCLPDTLTVAVSNDDCGECPDGETFQIFDRDHECAVWVPEDGNGKSCWIPICSIEGRRYFFFLNCGSDGKCTSFGMFTDFTDSSCTVPGDPHIGILLECTCRPFYLKFVVNDFEPTDWERAECDPPRPDPEAGIGPVFFEITE